jgi:DNA-binding NarL/FixJ family response regulator
MAIRILLVDDNALMRTATKIVLSTEKELTVIGEATDGLTGVRMAVELEPDIVLMDINMKPVNGIRATQVLLAKRPETVVIGFSALPHPRQERQLIEAGAASVILKSSTAKEIISGILHSYRQVQQSRHLQ